MRVRSRSPRDIRLLPSANRPSINQASAIITAPVVVIVNDTVWIRDGRLSNRTPKVGSWTTGRGPAAPAAVGPRAGRGGGRRAGGSWGGLSGARRVGSSPCKLAIDELSVWWRAAIRAA